jgi:hypothetical protein
MENQMRKAKTHFQQIPVAVVEKLVERQETEEDMYRGRRYDNSGPKRKSYVCWRGPEKLRLKLPKPLAGANFTEIGVL